MSEGIKTGLDGVEIMAMIYDRFGRPLTSMRISITSRCNLDCLYCHQEGIPKDNSSEMTAEEIGRIVGICADYGVRKVKITGGEPLLRKDVCEIIGFISNNNGIKDLSMTTNGVFLEKYAQGLKDAGLDRVNVSLDSIRPEIFSRVTKGDLTKVIAGIKKAVDVGLNPVKLNMVALKDINIDEIRDMIKFASETGAILQLIGLMDSEFSRDIFEKYYYDLRPLEKEFEKEATDIYVRKFMHGRTKYVLDRGTEVEVVFPMHNTNFCANCTRMRVTADGKFKPCLMRSDNLVDFLTPMRNGASDSDLEEIFKEAMRNREPYFKSKETLKDASTDIEVRA
ncbi:MAG: GTP 3',8-cyclase MoaA [Candidatus Hydrothermarchaeales archaeon]